MHEPSTAPRDSVFYDYKVYPFVPPPELQGGKSDAPVVIVGAGPIGLALAIDLARRGIKVVLLEAERQVSHGSRAVVLTRRSMEILRQIGVADRFEAKALTWSDGRSFYRGSEVYRMVMPHDAENRYLPGNNIAQQHIEEYLVDAAAATGLVDLRWGHRLEALEQDGDEVRLTVDTEAGPYTLAAAWAVAADGGRSAVRRLLGLRMEGRAYSGHFVITDIKASLPLPTQRLCFFDPDWNPGANVLVHRLPDSIWRIDYRLPDGETPEQALQPELVADRVNKVLDMLQPLTHQPRPDWTLDWATVYSASTLTLPDYRAGRVLFCGDAAHVLPIFGVRGANTGLQDAQNLAWKLGEVVQGRAGVALLDSYSQERVGAAREICDEGGKSTRFMVPPTEGFQLMRDAVLRLSLTQDFPKDLLHWRTSRPHVYSASPLNGDDEGFSAGPPPGDVIPDALVRAGEHLMDHLAQDFVLLGFAPLDAEVAEKAASIGVRLLTVGGDDIPDNAGHIAARFAAYPGTAYLIRPDGHVAARWQQPTADKLAASLHRARAH